MLSATITTHHDFRVAPVDRKLFGAFVEHLGRCVYTGIYEPEHPESDDRGFRKDVIDAVRDLGISTVRYPGGNFVSGYRWEDGVGPLERRPVRLDLAWHTTETNEFGTNEFMEWASRASIEPMMAVNLGTRGIMEAVDLLEYCNGGTHTALADLRRSHGAEKPYGITMWCLGNEMDGPWQTGHKTAQEYGRLAAETARAMRAVDPTLQLVACGSSNSGMPTFGRWEYEVLQETYEDVDFISAHSYYQEHDGDLGSFLASAVDLDGFVESVAATIEAVRAQKRSQKRVYISLDEWNVWYQSRQDEQVPQGDDWPVAPKLLEDNYSVADAVVVGSLLISILRHSDVIKSASLAQLVNVIAPIMTEPGGKMWKQTTYHPFQHVSQMARGEVLQTLISSPTYETNRYGDVDVLDAVSVANDSEEVVFAVNRSQHEQMELTVRSGHKVRSVQATTYASADPYWKAGPSDDASVLPVVNATARIEGKCVKVALPPVSWNVIRMPQA